MLGNRKLILDTFCEVYDLLQPWMDGDFFDFSRHRIVPGAIYLIGRAQMNHNRARVCELVRSGTNQVILSNPAEGSETLKDHCELVHQCADLILEHRMLLIGGGNMPPEWPCLTYDVFLPKILDYPENLTQIARAEEIYTQLDKPYKFMFLNGRCRRHRKYLIEQFDVNGLLDHAIWTNLENRNGNPDTLSLWHDGQDLMLRNRPTKTLEPKYEVTRYRDRVTMQSDQRFIKSDLFNQEWGEIYLQAEPYIDTYFSVVTETVYEYPYSFRTEKIWKPVAMGHPFIAVSNRGYYRDLHNLGFRTFGHVIDESFDQIENNQDRLIRIAQVVTDLCQQDLASFLKECYNVCKYNQQHLAHMRQKIRKEFPDRFSQFIQQYQ
jgi:hypothetical protein